MTERLAVDIGGTFVDAIRVDHRTGSTRLEKAPTTPREPSVGVLAAFEGLSIEDDDWRERVDVVVDNDDRYPEAPEGEKRAGLMRGRFRPGEVVSNRTVGGYGDPHDRDPEAVREDVVDGYVSRGHAREAYGVVVTDDGEVDRAATARLRSA